MEKTYNLDKTSWFINPWFDLIFLAGFPLFLIIIFYVKFLFLYFPEVLASNYLYTSLNFPHILAGLAVVYLYKKEMTEKPTQFIWGPLIFTSMLIVFVVLQNYRVLTITRAFWAGLHMFIQYYFILALYKLRNNDNLKFDKIVDITFLVAINADYLFRSMPFILRRYLGHSTSLIDTLASTSRPFLQVYWVFVRLILMVFLLRQAYLYFHYKKTHIFKILMFSSIFFTYYYSLNMFRSVGIALHAAISLHCIIWIIWCWYYIRQCFKRGILKKSKIISYVFKFDHPVVFILFLGLISLVYNYFFTFRLPTIHNNLIRTPLALIHFFIEVDIWKASGNHKFVSNLG